MTNVNANVSEPAVVGRPNSMRNVFVAFGLIVAVPLLESLTTGQSFSATSTQPAMVVVAAIIIALFSRSFYDVLVTQGVGAFFTVGAFEVLMAITPFMVKVLIFTIPVMILVLGALPLNFWIIYPFFGACAIARLIYTGKLMD